MPGVAIGNQRSRHGVRYLPDFRIQRASFEQRNMGDKEKGKEQAECQQLPVSVKSSSSSLSLPKRTSASASSGRLVKDSSSTSVSWTMMRGGERADERSGWRLRCKYQIGLFPLILMDVDVDVDDDQFNIFIFIFISMFSFNLFSSSGSAEFLLFAVERGKGKGNIYDNYYVLHMHIDIRLDLKMQPGSLYWRIRNELVSLMTADMVTSSISCAIDARNQGCWAGGCHPCHAFPYIYTYGHSRSRSD